MTRTTKATLLTWIAKQNDPFNRNGSPGPNLTLLFDPGSPFAGQFDEILVLYRDGGNGESEEYRKVLELEKEIRSRDSGLRIVKRPWMGSDPTDHAEIHDFLRLEIPKIRRDRNGKPLVVHISPGTPSMQTVWVLMAETGEIEPPVELVKTYRVEDRQLGEPTAVGVHVGLDTFFKVYQRNQQIARPEHEAVEWDPRRFQSARLKAVYAEARRFAQVKVPLLILGERGTGKTTLAAWFYKTGIFHPRRMGVRKLQQDQIH
ncbi:MAG TPA: sigma 54-interacting transcriptional regulator [Kiritimatiellia bacterium]|nr:sigma 54-interacting transcriptional regulator [Kiritimatiellia bacterium]